MSLFELDNEELKQPQLLGSHFIKEDVPKTTFVRMNSNVLK
jgi:hypothetical protein